MCGSRNIVEIDGVVGVSPFAIHVGVSPIAAAAAVPFETVVARIVVVVAAHGCHLPQLYWYFYRRGCYYYYRTPMRQEFVAAAAAAADYYD